MASKGTKTGAAVSSPTPRAKAPAASKPAVAASEVVKKQSPAPATSPVKAAPAKVEKIPAPAAAPQEKIAGTTAAATPVAPAVPTVEKIVKPVVDAAKPVVATAKKELPTMTNTIETMTAKTQTMFAEMNDKAKVAMEKSSKMVEEMSDLTKGNVEAVVESGKIAAKGMETLGHDAAEYGRKSFESASAAMKSFAAVKSPTEFFKMQGDFVRQAFDAYVAEASKTTEAVMKLAGEAAQPISNRVAVAADKMKIAA